MTISIIGFPRIGADRELKFATEHYFKKETTESELQKVAREIRSKNWQIQKRAGIEFPVSNDFSLYDQMLDTAFFLNAIPERYQALKLNRLETYFAVARGYQGKEADVKALPMKKWFNTNYHYIVPELSKITTIQADYGKVISEYLEADRQGIKTRPVLIGPYTFLKLATYLDDTKPEDFVSGIQAAYITLLHTLNQHHVAWLQLDEPALVLEQTKEDLLLFEHLYDGLLPHKNDVKILLQTYFGDVRDSYSKIIQLDFDGIGLDFIEGKESLSLIKKFGFSINKKLFVGLVNGKNIWRNNYQKSLDLLGQLPKGLDLVLSTSCSLQHVPVTTQSETTLDPQILKHFAFAAEKLQELNDLETIYFGNNTELLNKNQKLFNKKRISKNEHLKNQIEQLAAADFRRVPERAVRREVQKKALNLPLLPTTTIGSFPQTKDVRHARLANKKHELSDVDYEHFLKTEIAEWIHWQESIGLDVLVHGEFERNDMVEYFGQQLEGYVFTQKAWVQSYGTRCVKPPIIWGDITRPKAMTVRWSAFAQSQTNKIMKGMLTGPVTILNWSFPREDISLKESTLQLALAIQQEVLDLQDAGIRIIQIDEAALREKLPLRKSDWYSDYLDWAIPAFRLVHAKVKPETQIHTHMCYSEFEDIIQAIDDMDADVISFEASRSDLSILDSLKQNHFETQVGPGVYDIHSPRIPSVSEIKTQMSRILEKIPIEQVWINPDCGLKTRGIAETKPSLEHLVKAVSSLRKALNENDSTD